MGYRAICTFGCEFHPEFENSADAADAAVEHLWEAHRVAVDPLDAGDFVLPARPRRSA